MKKYIVCFILSTFAILVSKEINHAQSVAMINTGKVKPQKSLKYLALGDSYTKGEGVPYEESYPALLTTRLKDKGYDVQELRVIAQTGWTTDDLKNAIKRANPSNQYGLVSLLIGVNNQFQSKSIEEYEKEFRELLLNAIELAGGQKDKVFVVSIPDYGITPFGKSNQAFISRQIELFNAVNKKVTDNYQVKYFNITPISRDAEQNADLLCRDGLHPSGSMYKQWVNLMIREVEDLVKK